MPHEKRSRLRLPHKEYKALCNRVFERDGWKCRVCRRRDDLHCHHIIFRSRGGDDASWNLLTMCSKCHDALHIDKVIIILPKTEGQPINADTGVKILLVHGWKPKWAVKP